MWERRGATGARTELGAHPACQVCRRRWTCQGPRKEQGSRPRGPLSGRQLAGLSAPWALGGFSFKRARPWGCGNRDCTPQAEVRERGPQTAARPSPTRFPKKQQGKMRKKGREKEALRKWLGFFCFVLFLWLGNSFLFNGIIVRCLDELQLIDPFTY